MAYKFTKVPYANNYLQCSYKLYFSINIKLALSSFFNIFLLLFNALGPLLHKLLYALGKERFQLSSKPLMHRSLHFLVQSESRAPYCLFEWTKQVIVRRGKIGTIRRMSHYIKLEFPEGFCSVSSSMWTGIVVQQQHISTVYNTQNYWVFRLCPWSSILETRKHVLETESVSILGGGRHVLSWVP
jgi:hypothetical protein